MPEEKYFHFNSIVQCGEETEESDTVTLKNGIDVYPLKKHLKF